MEFWYFETSAVNYLLDMMTDGDAIETKKLQLIKGRDWCLSPITLLEILQTSDPVRRDQIVRFSQRLFSEQLLASPEEMIIHYIHQGFPREEPRIRLQSKGVMGRVWKDVVRNPEKQIHIDIDDLKRRAKAVKDFTRYIHKVINGDDSIILPVTSEADFAVSLESMLNNLEFIKSDPEYSPERRIVFKLAILYLILLLCCQGGPDYEASQRLWDSVGHQRTSCRINYALKTWEPLIYRGPLNTLAQMAYCQSKTRFSRGVYNDSLHAMYLNYTDFLFSSDEHFQALKERLSGTPYGHRIQIINELEFMREENQGDFCASEIVT